MIKYYISILILIFISVIYCSVMIIRKKTNRLIDIIFFTIMPLVIFGLLVSVAGYYLFVVNNWLFQSKHDGFAGNFIGGIIGGVVALIIAKFQYRTSKIEDNKMREKQFKAFYISLKSEIKYNIDLLHRLIETTMDNYSKFQSSNGIPFAIDTWEAVKLSSLFIDKVSENSYIILSNMYYDLQILKCSRVTITEKILNELYVTMKNVLANIEEMR